MHKVSIIVNPDEEGPDKLYHHPVIESKESHPNQQLQISFRV